MRIRIAHETRYSYDRPARGVLQILRMTPRDHDGQHVVSWRVEPQPDGKLRPGEDAYGNLCHAFEADEPLSDLVLTVTGEIETHDTAGVVRGSLERVPDDFYLRETPLTESDDAIRGFAAEISGDGGPDTLATLHRLLVGLNERMIFDTSPTDSGTTAAQAFGMGRGVCQDLSHVFLAVSRQLGIPARYVSGYLHPKPGAPIGEAVKGESHAWVEWWDGSWTGYDPTNVVEIGTRHVTLGRGRDYKDVPPLKGIFSGPRSEGHSVVVEVTRLA